MKQLQVEKLFEAYLTAYDAVPREAMELDFRLMVRTMQALAESQPISVERLAEDRDMPLEQVRTILERGETIGSAQLDSDG